MAAYIPQSSAKYTWDVRFSFKMLIKMENIFAWANTTSSHRNVIEGNRVLNANHIIKIGKIQNNSSDHVSLTALCLQTSNLKELPHEINGIIRVNGEIVSFKCSCKAGLSEKCKHTIAVLLYCSKHDFETFETLSCTDQPCAWKKVLHKQALTQYEFKPLDEHECLRPPLKKYILDESKVISLQEKIFQELPNSAITKRKIGRHSPVELKIPNEGRLTELEQDLLNKIFNREESLTMKKISEVEVDELGSCCKNTLMKLCGDCQTICKDTKMFYANWHQERRFRVTGSTCYGLFTYTGNKNPNWKKKSDNHINPKSFKTEYTEYGKVMEKKARDLFVKEHNQVVVETGLIVSKLNPWFAYSPDGIICKDGKPDQLLEIKCLKNGKTMTAESVAQTEIGKCLVLNKCGEIELKQKHKYYGQVQHGMSILKLKNTAFVFYADFDKSLFVVNVKFDEIFAMKMLKALKRMYYKIMLHEICLTNDNNENEQNLENVT